MACCEKIIDEQEKYDFMNYPAQVSIYYNISKENIYYRIEFKIDSDEELIVWNLNSDHYKYIKKLNLLIKKIINIINQINQSNFQDIIKSLSKITKMLKQNSLCDNLIIDNEKKYESIKIIDYRTYDQIITLKNTLLYAPDNYLNLKNKKILNEQLECIYDSRKIIYYEQTICNILNRINYIIDILPHIYLYSFEYNKIKKNLLIFLFKIRLCCNLYYVCKNIQNKKRFITEDYKITLYKLFKYIC